METLSINRQTSGSQSFCHAHRVSKNVPPLTCYILTYTIRLRQFWQKCYHTKKVRNQMMLNFLHYLAKQETQELRFFILALPTNTQTKDIQIITWSLLNYHSFLKWSSVCIKQLKST